jgi:hypothetical protein
MTVTIMISVYSVYSVYYDCVVFMFSSSLAGGVAAFLTSPLDLAKLRLQVDRTKSQQRHAAMSTFQASEYNTYKSFYDVLKKTFMNEGGVRALYRGAFARVSILSNYFLFDLCTVLY